MKLVTFREQQASSVQFGVVIEDVVVSFETLQRKKQENYPFLRNIEEYLQSLPDSELVARELYQFGLENLDTFLSGETIPFSKIQFLPPLPNPPALLDYGLTPRHLYNSGSTLANRELRWPFNTLFKMFLKKQFRKEQQEARFRYYKGNHHSIIGDHDEMDWPSFTSYLDIEPELAIVCGKTRDNVGETVTDIAGYLIFNDISARDVQFPDFLGMTGPCQSKDFQRSNGLGPFLVTPDEIENPLGLDVTVMINDQVTWRGSTKEYSANPQEVLQHLNQIFTPVPGTVIGMGTIPDCCGLDRDEWISPGDKIAITMEGLGTLRQLVPKDIGKLETSRWRRREDLATYYK